MATSDTSARNALLAASAQSPTAKPTASLIFTALATLRLRTTGDGPPEIPQPDPIQQRLLGPLETDPRKLADPPGLMCELRG